LQINRYFLNKTKITLNLLSIKATLHGLKGKSAILPFSRHLSIPITGAQKWMFVLIDKDFIISLALAEHFKFDERRKKSIFAE